MSKSSSKTPKKLILSLNVILLFCKEGETLSEIRGSVVGRIAFPMRLP